MSGRRAILIFVTGLGLAFCPLTRAGQSVTLAWNPSPSPSVVGYRIYCSTDGTNYNNQWDAGANTSWSVTGLQEGTTNYFEVSAYDATNNQSPPSNPVEFVVPVASDTATVQGNSTTNTVAAPGNSTTNTVAAPGNSTNAGSVNGGGGLISIPPASPPVFVAVPDQSVNVGFALLVTNVVIETNVPPREITFSLGSDAPAGASISSNGVFGWAPAREQGSTTNLITVWAVDDGTPALSNSVSFTVTVGACVEVTVGSSAVLVGNNTSVSVTLFSTVGLTNLNFSIATLAGRFDNWSFTSGNPVAAAAVQASDPSQPQFRFAIPNGQTAPGTTSLGTISVQSLATGDSTFAPLTLSNIVATASDNTPVGSVFVSSGRVALIAAQPMLEASFTNGATRVLNLYGNPGFNYMVMSTTNLSAPANWTTFTNFTLIAPVHSITPGTVAGQMEFFRAARL